MASGSLSSLGIGSDVLTYDVIEKLRAADESNIIDPIDTKIEKNTEKQAELATLMGNLGTLKGSADSLSDISSYLERSAKVTGDEITASAGAGLSVQDIKIEVEQLAQTDIYQVGTKYEARDSTFSSQNSQLTFYAGGTEYSIDIRAGQTLEDVAQAITDQTDGEYVGTILKSGGDKPFQLMINSKESGEDNKIYFGSSTESYSIQAGDFTADATGSGDLTFKFNKIGDPTTEIEIDVDLTAITGSTSNGSYENANLLLDQIKTDLETALTAAGEDISDYLFDPDDSSTWNNPLKFGLGSDGKSIIFNDSRGEKIEVGGTMASDLGFKTETVDHSYTVEGGQVLNGLIEGKVSIAGNELDLSTVTASGNTRAENATAIADAINSMAGFSATVGDDGDSLLIKNDSGGNVSITVVGEKGTDEYTDSSSAITKIGLNAGSYTSQSDFLSNTIKLNNIQIAQDAEFTYNDMKITRSTNYIDDVVSGLSITLNKVHEAGDSSQIRITQDTDSIIEEVKSFVESYNEMADMLTEYTKYDPDTGVAGIFQGNSDIYSIRSSLNNILLYSSAEGKSLIDFGIYLNEDGKLEMDEEKLTSKIVDDPEAAEELFRGYNTTVNGQDTTIDGVFTRLRDSLDSLITGSDSRLKLYETELESVYDRYQDERERAVKQLDSRYEIMAARFAAYDGLIAEMNNSFASLQSMIEAQANS